MVWRSWRNAVISSSVILMTSRRFMTPQSARNERSSGGEVGPAGEDHVGFLGDQCLRGSHQAEQRVGGRVHVGGGVAAGLVDRAKDGPERVVIGGECVVGDRGG